MLKAEMEFMLQNLEKTLEINTELDGNPINLVNTNAQQKVEEKGDYLFLNYEKITPENFFSRIKVSDGKEDLLKRA
jgi:hypothetical protein